MDSECGPVVQRTIERSYLNGIQNQHQVWELNIPENIPRFGIKIRK